MCDKVSPNVSSDLFIFLTDMKLEEYVAVLFLETPYRYYPDIYKTQKMCDEAVDDSLAALKFISD